MGLRLFRHLVYKTKPRKRFLKSVSDIIDDNSLFSFNNADMETAGIAIQEELRRLEQNLQMGELELMSKRLKVRSLDQMKYMTPRLRFLFRLKLLLFYIVSELLLCLCSGGIMIHVGITYQSRSLIRIHVRHIGMIKRPEPLFNLRRYERTGTFTNPISLGFFLRDVFIVRWLNGR